MSDSGDYSELSAPVQYGQRRAASRIKAGEAGQTGRRNKQPRPLIGGDVVGSMKRGIKDHSGDLKRRESRLLFLCKSQKLNLERPGERCCADMARFNRWRSVLRPYRHMDQEIIRTLE
jgi:hypothetical protein